ncbi:MAG: heat-shock protein Hsp20 [Candidatus Poribacteria bacterium]|nr:MAG: heat-shock protein Hsp20 [Candidatus Poribacteria bacterium]
MAVVRWTPRRMLSPFEEIDRLFDAMWPTFDRLTRGGAWYPAVDVRETADAVEVTAELPGLDPKDVEIHVKDNVLTISGEKKLEEERNEGNVYYAERQFGKFERALTLPAYVQADQARASFKNGVLTIHLPKVEQERTRRIEIKTE